GRVLLVDWFTFLVLGSKLRDLRMLPPERASKGGSGGPVYKPFVKDRSLSLGNGAGIDYTRVCELVVSDQEDGQPVQRVVIIAENIADVVCCRIPVVFPDLLQYGLKFHHFTCVASDHGKGKTGAKE